MKERQIGAGYGASLDGDPATAVEWSVPWADLMMVMFILFAILYSYQIAERNIIESPDSPELAATLAPETTYDRTVDAVRASDLAGVEVELQANRSIRLSLHGPLLFDLGRAELKSDTLPFLDRLAGILAGSTYSVNVVGHTDTYPIHTERFPTNWELSSARASRVARYLISAGSLNPARFTVTGHALYQPAVPNDSQANKARNRRVEIIISRNKIKDLRSAS